MKVFLIEEEYENWTPEKKVIAVFSTKEKAEQAIILLEGKSKDLISYWILEFTIDEE